MPVPLGRYEAVGVGRTLSHTSWVQLLERLGPLPAIGVLGRPVKGGVTQFTFSEAHRIFTRLQAPP